MAKFYDFIRDLLQSELSFSVRDIMETEWLDLLAILKKEEAPQEVMSLEEFITRL